MCALQLCRGLVELNCCIFRRFCSFQVFLLLLGVKRFSLSCFFCLAGGLWVQRMFLPSSQLVIVCPSTDTEGRTQWAGGTKSRDGARVGVPKAALQVRVPAAPHLSLVLPGTRWGSSSAPTWFHVRAERSCWRSLGGGTSNWGRSVNLQIPKWRASVAILQRGIQVWLFWRNNRWDCSLLVEKNDL